MIIRKRNLAALMLAVTLASCTKNTERTITTIEEKMSYALGRQVGETIQRQKLPVDHEIFAFGLEDAMNEKEPRIPAAEVQAALMKAQEMALKSQTASLEMTEKNRTAGEKFLAANKAKKGIHVTPTGLQYEVLKQGKGARPTDQDIVEVHFTATLIDGQKFDSSHDRGAPGKFSVKNVIPGLSEAFKLMNVGSKWKLTVPASLAYGRAGSLPDVPPESALLYELELISVEKSPTAPEPGSTK